MADPLPKPAVWLVEFLCANGHQVLTGGPYLGTVTKSLQEAPTWVQSPSPYRRPLLGYSHQVLTGGPYLGTVTKSLQEAPTWVQSPSPYRRPLLGYSHQVLTGGPYLSTVTKSLQEAPTCVLSKTARSIHKLHSLVRKKRGGGGRNIVWVDFRVVDNVVYT